MGRLYIDRDTLTYTVNQSLLYWGGGVFGKLIYECLVDSNEPENYFDDQPRFFQPYKNKEDWKNIYAPISAPVTLLILAAEMALGFIVYAINTVRSVFSGEELKENATIAGKSLLNTILFGVAALVSPLVSLVDIIGSAISAGIDACSEHDTSFSMY